ncbi:hypothetical protein QC761_507958 [Podospora bellae-mahoneyi]|uniref:Profilin n=1 Tax=Podospora bellae-mahoneyi TaxID=2093777 RepID=A0ABR0FEY5_9PEZI|nr:hypothetical protein QC761_507958 [Podospora bellae-mahoneyi]
MACPMEEVPLASAPYFTALSYAWDSEHGTDPTICDGGLIYVTKNCVAALRNVCKDKSTNKRINGKGGKGHQITIMGDIYKVTRVRVWLGEQDESNALLCKYFKKVAGFGGYWKDE